MFASTLCCGLLKVLREISRYSLEEILSTASGDMVLLMLPMMMVTAFEDTRDTSPTMPDAVTFTFSPTFSGPCFCTGAGVSPEGAL